MPDEIALKRFRQVSIEETTKDIMKAPSRSCELDPIPTDLLKEVTQELSPILIEPNKYITETGYIPHGTQKGSSLTTT